MRDEAEDISRRPPPPPPRTAPPPPPPRPIGGGDDAHWGNCSPAFRANAEALLWTLRDGDGWVVLSAEIVEAYPASPLAHCIVAHAHRMLGALSTASVHLTRAAELAPRCPQIALALAEVLLAMGEDTMAMDVCDRALSVTNNSDPALYLPTLGIARVLASTTPDHRVSVRRTQLCWLRAKAMKAEDALLTPNPLMEESQVADCGADTETAPDTECSWDNIPDELDALVLSFLKSPYDRARVQSVSRRWRAASAYLTSPEYETVMLIHPFFFMSEPFKNDPMAKGAPITFHRTAFRRQYRGEAVGSCGSWIICMEPDPDNIRITRFSGLKKFIGAYLLDPISGCLEINLPNPTDLPHLDSTEWLSLQKDKDKSETKWCFQHSNSDSPSKMAILKAVLSSEPEADSKFVMMALAKTEKVYHLAICKAGVQYWYFLHAKFFSHDTEIAYFNGELYVLDRSMVLIGMKVGVNEQLQAEVQNLRNCNLQSASIDRNGQLNNLVPSKSGLLLIRRTFKPSDTEVLNVEVYQVDFKSDLCTLTEKKDLDGQSVFVSEKACVCINGSVRTENFDADCVYFLDFSCRDLLSGDSENGYFYRGIKYDVKDKMLSQFEIWAPHMEGSPVWFKSP